MNSSNSLQPSFYSSALSEKGAYSRTKAMLGGSILYSSSSAKAGMLYSTPITEALHQMQSTVMEIQSMLITSTNHLASIHNESEHLPEKALNASFPLQTTHSANGLISIVTIQKNCTSSMLAIENSTDSTLKPGHSERNLLLMILIPVAVVAVITAITVFLCCYLKKKKSSHREHKLDRNVETNISWFDVFDLQLTVGNWGAMNDLNEPTDFAIPMGPLCMNNFAFENYNNAVEDSMLDRYSTKSILGRDFNHLRRSSEIHPAERALSKGFELERARTKAVFKSTHVNSGAEFETTCT